MKVILSESPHLFSFHEKFITFCLIPHAEPAFPTNPIRNTALNHPKWPHRSSLQQRVVPRFALRSADDQHTTEMGFTQLHPRTAVLPTTIMVVGYDQIWVHVNWLHCTLIGTVSRRRLPFVCMMHGTVNEISNKHAALIIHARADANIDDASRVSFCLCV